MPRDPLRIAMAVSEHQRAEWISRRCRSVSIEAEDLSRERRDVLCEALGRRVAGGRVQQSVGPELQPAAIVNGRGWNVVDQDRPLSKLAVDLAVSHDPIDA